MCCGSRFSRCITGTTFRPWYRSMKPWTSPRNSPRIKAANSSTAYWTRSRITSCGRLGPPNCRTRVKLTPCVIVASSAAPMLADLHLHSYFSDGTFSPEELAQRARTEGLSVIALTDHDTVGGCERMAVACAAEGIE